MKKAAIHIAVLLSVVFMVPVAWSESGLEGRNLVTMEGSNAVVAVDLGGGSIVDFHLKDQGLNPLTWNFPERGDHKPRHMGHFICLGRWGPGTKTETANGMPYHGEASHVVWKVAAPPVRKAGKISTELSADLPMGGLRIHRTLRLDETEAVLTVTEAVTNVNKLGRIYNFVQHGTVGPPFLDESVMVDTKVKKGIFQFGNVPNPEEPVIYWPRAVQRGRLVDFRRLTGKDAPSVISFIFNENAEYGWCTLSNAGKGLMLGYVWKTADYPWLNMWFDVRDGKPAARGIEFGTTGLHQPVPVQVAQGKIFDTQLYEYLDAGETREKSYTAFLVKIPSDYRGVSDVVFSPGMLTLKEYGDDSSRDINVGLR